MAEVRPRCVALVLTYRRPRLATRTVEWLIERQHFTVEDILLVVNGEGGLDSDELERSIDVLRLGENLGPAGGYAHGMELISTTSDADWLYVVEDDACLLGLPDGHVQQVLDDLDRAPHDIGIVTAFGRQLDPRTGRTTHLEVPADAPTFVPCEVAAWGASLVDLSLVRDGLLPDRSLFFGYEDFDFMMKVRDSGHSVVCHAATARTVGVGSTDSGRTAAFAGERPTDRDEPWRLYWQARNFVILARRHGRWTWYIDHLVRSARRWQLWGPSAVNAGAILLGLVEGVMGTKRFASRYQRVAGEYRR